MSGRGSGRRRARQHPGDRPRARRSSVRRALPGDRRARHPVRRSVLHGGVVDGRLLSTVMPGTQAEGAQRAVLPDLSRRARGRVPGLQALPARGHAREPGVEPAPGPRRARDAARRRRRRGPRGRRRPGRPPRAQPAPPDPAARDGARGRAASARPRPTRADGPQPARGKRPAAGRRRVRGRLRVGPAVQRHDPRGVRRSSRRDPDKRSTRRCGCPERPQRGDRWPGAARPHPSCAPTLRRPRRLQVPRGACRQRRRVRTGTRQRPVTLCNPTGVSGPEGGVSGEFGDLETSRHSQPIPTTATSAL
jgi:hypothetical protein